MYIVLASAARNIPVPTGTEPEAYLQGALTRTARPPGPPPSCPPENWPRRSAAWTQRHRAGSSNPPAMFICHWSPPGRAWTAATIWRWSAVSLLSLSVYAPDTEYVRVLRAQPLTHQDDEFLCAICRRCSSPPTSSRSSRHPGLTGRRWKTWWLNCRTSWPPLLPRRSALDCSCCWRPNRPAL